MESRKKTDREVRRKWPVLNPTEAERARIQAGARAAGMSLSAYLIACACQTRIVYRQDWIRHERRLAAIDARLDLLAREIRDRADAVDAGLILAALVEFEALVLEMSCGGDPEVVPGTGGANEDPLAC